MKNKESNLGEIRECPACNDAEVAETAMYRRWKEDYGKENADFYQSLVDRKRNPRHD